MIYLLYHNNCHHCYYHYYHIYVNIYIYIDILYTHTHFLDFCTYMPITYCEPRIKTPNHLHGYASILTANGNRGPCPVGTIHWIWGFVIFLNSICIGIETQQSINRDLLPGWPGEALIHSRFWCSHFWISWDGCLARVAGHWLCFHFDLPTGNTSSRFCIWSSQPSWWMVAYLNKSSDRGHYQWAIVCWGSSKCVKTKGNCNSSQVSMDSPGDPQAKKRR